MDELSATTLAARAGVGIDFVETLVALGMLATEASGGFAASAVRRVRVIEGLEHGGLPLPQLAEAVRRGDLSFDFVEQPSYDRYAALTDITFGDLSARTGIPLEILCAVREATGFAQPQPDDRVRENEMPIVSVLQLELENGVRPEHVERSLRVCGDSLRRIAETGADWWYSDVMLPLFKAGATGREIASQTEAFATALSDVDDAAILALYHGQQANAWMRNIFEGFEAVLARSGLHTPVDRPPAICFLDLTGYSRLTEEQGDEAAADLAERLARLVRRASAEHDGKPVKWLGDGVMFHFRDPGAAVAAALDMVDGAAKSGLPPAHVGVHAGPILFQEGDYFGRTVNAASRIADYARQGEVLVTREVVEAGDVAGVRFDEIGPVELKGLSAPLTLYAARRQG